MPPIPSRRLVIDACVARSAGGEDAVYPTPRNCRAFLLAVLDNGHRVVMTPALAAEWNRHRSRFARTWQVSMTARKRVLHLDVAEDPHLRHRVAQTAEHESQKAAMLKDCHLLEAAAASDRSVISMDEVVRALFSSASGSMPDLRGVVWVNPDREHERPVVWLSQGARPDLERCLGFGVQEP